MENFVEILNDMIQENMGTIDKIVSKQIKSNGFDPAGGSSSGSANTGEIGYGGVSLECKLKYDVKGLTGLSNSSFQKLHIDTAHIALGTHRFSGTGSFKFGSRNHLTAHGSGSVTGTFENWVKNISKTVSVGAKATINGYYLSGSVSVTGVIKNNKVTIESMIIEESNTHIGDVDVDVDVNGLGIFNPVINLVAGAFANGFATLASNALDGLFPLVNNVIKAKVLPISVDVKELAA